MFLKKKENTLQEIKDAMNDEETPSAPAKPQFTAPMKPQFTAPLRAQPNVMPIIPAQPERETSAPLFVKIDKYREVLKGVQEMKLFVSGVKQTFVVLQEIEALRADAINIMRATVQKLDKSITEMDAELLRPKGVSLNDMGVAAAEVHHLESTLTDLQKQLGTLRRDMEGLR
jgi:hypothetical protein